MWRKVPRVYKQLLRDEKLWVALLDDKDSGESISGRVSRYKALSTELLSALLVPANSATTCTHGACGGTAAVSMASASNSIHVTVAVSGLVPKGSDVDTFVVRLETLENGSNQPRQIEEIVTVQKPQEVSCYFVGRPCHHPSTALVFRHFLGGAAYKKKRVAADSEIPGQGPTCCSSQNEWRFRCRCAASQRETKIPPTSRGPEMRQPSACLCARCRPGMNPAIARDQQRSITTATAARHWHTAHSIGRAHWPASWPHASNSGIHRALHSNADGWIFGFRHLAGRRMRVASID